VDVSDKKSKTYADDKIRKSFAEKIISIRGCGKIKFAEF